MFEKIAYAAAPGPGAGAEANPLAPFIPLVLIFIIFYFLLIRPQQKRSGELQKLVDNLKKGDRIITAGGVIGTVMSIQKDYVVIRTGDQDKEGAKMEILKSAITGLRNEGDVNG